MPVYNNEEFREELGDEIVIRTTDTGEIKHIHAQGHTGTGYLYMNNWTDAESKLVAFSDKIPQPWLLELRKKGVQI